MLNEHNAIIFKPLLPRMLEFNKSMQIWNKMNPRIKTIGFTISALNNGTILDHKLF